MTISIITLFPEMVQSFLSESIIKRAQDKGKVEIKIVNLRDFGEGVHKTVDDRPYGGGAGMVLRVDCLNKAINHVKTQNSKIKTKDSKTILTSAKGKVFNQSRAEELSKLDNLVIICGHYEGVDERIMDHIDEEISLGDFVMTGGEITACAVIDAVVRLVPGVLKKKEATAEESFFKVGVDELLEIFPTDATLKEKKKNNTTFVTLLEYAHYTRPVDFEGKVVLDVLLSGNHKEIQKWRIENAYLQTKKKRPDLLR